MSHPLSLNAQFDRMEAIERSLDVGLLPAVAEDLTPPPALAPMLLQDDVFDAPLMRHGYSLVYADPPYAGCRFKYARGRNSRQWGRNARADFLRELVGRMEWLRAPDGICALSMGTNELKLLHLFPSNARVFAWVKPYAVFRPGVYPAYSWEPVVAWGRFCNRAEQKAHVKTPPDWIGMSPKRPKKGQHENPKPDTFGAWVIDLTLGPRREGEVLELFAGTAPIAKAACALGMPAVAVDLENHL